MKILFSILVAAVILLSLHIFRVNKTQDTELKREITKLCITLAEQSYFKGQKGAIRGDIRIELSSDSTYIRSKSCWDNGQKPAWNPSKLDSK